MSILRTVSTIGSARRSSQTNEYGVSLLGVTTAVSSYVNTRRSLNSVLSGALYWVEDLSTVNSYCTA